ncbi:VC0807 family protein [Amycolatopsis pigmentata]|uniref:VC0807 family protein n=1 Tax=Amycolatopsis pigmentata TaxID=450801 RepID=A0ABW5FRT8_9PSEU
MTVDVTAPKNTTSTKNPLVQGLTPLVLDVALPVGTYYLLSLGFGLNDLVSLGFGSAIPAVRTIWGVVAQRRLNPLAALMLVVNVAGLLLSLLSGDPRLMLAKESGVSSVIGVVMLASVAMGRPIMSSVLRPLFGGGDPARLAVWDRLSATSPAFRRAEHTYTTIWGVVLLLECAVRIVGVYTLPVHTMVWLGTVILVTALALAFRLSFALAVKPMKTLFLAERAAG